MTFPSPRALPFFINSVCFSVQACSPFQEVISIQHRHPRPELTNVIFEPDKVTRNEIIDARKSCSAIIPWQPPQNSTIEEYCGCAAQVRRIRSLLLPFHFRGIYNAQLGF